MSAKSIILVENDNNLRQSIALILQRAGYVVSATDRADRALELLSKRKYHLLISDINLSETSKVLLPRVLRIFPQLPIVILTDQSKIEAEIESKLFSAYYLIKPVAPERLLDYVGSILGRENNHGHSNNQGLLEDRL